MDASILHMDASGRHDFNNHISSRQSAAVHARLQEVEDDAAVTALGTLLASMRQSYRRSTVEATCHIFDSHGQIMVLA
jgi:hypothetical protein